MTPFLRFCILGQVCLLFASAWGAQVEGACERLRTPKEVMECALEVHPDMVRAQAQVRQSEELEGIGRQMPNPEFGFRGLLGSSLGDSIFDTDLDLTQPIELGGKRSARIQKAAAEKEIASADFLKTKESVTLSTLKGLYRLRQLREELGVIEESLKTYGQILGQYRGRPRLTPEQQVSFSVFDLARADYQLKKVDVEAEEYSLLRSFEVALGRRWAPTPGALPEPREDWPQLQGSAPEGPSMERLRGSAMMRAQAELRESEALLSVERGSSWPDLKVGPSYSSQTQGPYTTHTFGANITFAIPVFHVNSAGREWAARGILRAEESLNATRREVGNAWRVLSDRYSRAVSALKAAPRLEAVEKKHRNVEQLFERGVIPSSLVIEAHRQMVDYTKSRNEKELEAIEALWTLYAIEGRMFKEELK